MSLVVLETFIRQYIEAQPVPHADFSWHGGEPTMLGLDFFRRVVALQKKYAPPGFNINNVLQTNGTLLNSAWCRFFKEQQFLIGLSVDGPPEMHNTYRKTKCNSTNYEGTVRAVQLLRQYEVDFNVLCCVHAANADHPLQVYRYLRDHLGVRFLQFIPVVEPSSTINQPGPHSVCGKKYGQFLKTVFDEWVSCDVGHVFVQIFDMALGVWSGYPASLCVFSRTCGRALALEHNGDLYACDHYVDEQHSLGNILELSLVRMVESNKQQQFGKQKETTLAPDCLSCPVRFVCHGACPKDRRPVEGADYNLNILCEGYQDFFTHISRPMQQMAGYLRDYDH